MTSIGSIFKCFVTREWPYKKDLRGVAFVGGSVLLLEVSYEVLNAQTKPRVSFFLLSADPRCKTLHTNILPYHDENGLNRQNYKQAPR